jgi:hypothetical protein
MFCATDLEPEPPAERPSSGGVREGLQPADAVRDTGPPTRGRRELDGLQDVLDGRVLREVRVGEIEARRTFERGRELHDRERVEADVSKASAGIEHVVAPSSNRGRRRSRC